MLTGRRFIDTLYFCCRGRMHRDSQSYDAERSGCTAGKGRTIKVSKANILSREVSI